MKLYLRLILLLALLLLSLSACQPFADSLAPYLCQEDEAMVVKSNNYKPGKTSYTFHCKGSGNYEQDVTASVVIIILGLVLLGILLLMTPFVITVIYVIKTGKSNARKSSNSNESIASLNPEATTRSRLKDKLHELDEAYKDRLLTPEEYKEKKKKILDDFA